MQTNLNMEEQRRLDSLPAAGLINRNDVADFLGVKESTIRRWEKEELEGFPKPIRFSSRCTRYEAEEVVAWYEQLRLNRAG